MSVKISRKFILNFSLGVTYISCSTRLSFSAPVPPASLLSVSLALPASLLKGTAGISNLGLDCELIQEGNPVRDQVVSSSLLRSVYSI